MPWLRCCSKRGARVCGISRRTPEDLVGHAHFSFESVDLADPPRAAAAVEKLLDGVAHLDLAVLNAGILSKFGDMRETPLEHLRHVMDVNVWANKTVLDTLLGSDQPLTVSQVVTISSGASVNGNRGWNGYSISKAALNMLTMLYARECPSTHFTALAPGIVDTAMQAAVAQQPHDPRFPALESLRSKRGTAAMPSAAAAAARLLEVMAKLPSAVETGSYVDVRTFEN